jgi:hypothetical protein
MSEPRAHDTRHLAKRRDRRVERLAILLVVLPVTIGLIGLLIYKLVI